MSTLTASIILIVIMCASCGREKSETSDSAAIIPTDEFHADNDIAMIVRSMADAIKVHEKLDSTLYDFKGILTDGSGKPLYTDINGIPGEWCVDVICPDSAVIYPVKDGDLLAEDLKAYILYSLGIDRSTLIMQHDADKAHPYHSQSFLNDSTVIRFDIRDKSTVDAVSCLPSMAITVFSEKIRKTIPTTETAS